MKFNVQGYRIKAFVIGIVSLLGLTMLAVLLELSIGLTLFIDIWWAVWCAKFFARNEVWLEHLSRNYE